MTTEGDTKSPTVDSHPLAVLLVHTTAVDSMVMVDITTLPGGSMQFSVAFQHGVIPLLVSVPILMEQTQDVLSSAGRIVLTIAATLFLAYLVLMTSALLVFSVRGWAHTALERHKNLAIVPRHEAFPAMVEQS
ncbi:hypothetical protein [Tessaracoccus antarcticus]|uniref:Uncharacterized protein n=1 Tax=Tessaracoccus antarcticus TaxID=2479848 RepID=A0A3M0GC29_9ACTN|nr:hypothetical protein [Tessaracoccus antarcticus]RMB60162.1 hypothetical protein EAX62_10765 [Tessaracoccus antarcticus]